ncbi:MAG: hypothetical protein RL077_5870 [Verrucomicrobiota bacterium]
MTNARVGLSNIVMPHPQRVGTSPARVRVISTKGLKVKVNVKEKVIGEPAQCLGVIPLATELVENSLERNPVVTFIGRLGGLLLRLLPRRSPASPPSSGGANRRQCRVGTKASVRQMKLESFSYSRVSPTGSPDASPKASRTFLEPTRPPGSRGKSTCRRALPNPVAGGLEAPPV